MNIKDKRRGNVKSKYTCVQGMRRINGKIDWVVNMKGITKSPFKTEREAAIAVDKILIKKGKEPVNILIRSKK